MLMLTLALASSSFVRRRRHRQPRPQLAPDRQHSERTRTWSTGQLDHTTRSQTTAFSRHMSSNAERLSTAKHQNRQVMRRCCCCCCCWCLLQVNVTDSQSSRMSSRLSTT